MGQAENERKQVRFLVGVNLWRCEGKSDFIANQCLMAMGNWYRKGGFRFCFPFGRVPGIRYLWLSRPAIHMF